MSTAASRHPALAALRPGILAMRGYTPGEQRNHQVVKLNTNECPWPASPTVAQAVGEAVSGLRRYPDPLSTPVREAAARCYGVHPDSVLPGNGSDDCLTILYRAVGGPDATVACPWPTYGLYDVLAELQDVPIHHHAYTDTDKAGSWSLPRSLLDDPADLTLIANPNNPSGTLVPREAILELATKRLATGGLVVVDEAYVDYAPAGTSLLDVLSDYPNLVVLRTFSKSYALAGARLGLLFGAPELVAELRKVKDSYNLSGLAQAAAVAALDDRKAHATLCADGIRARKSLESLAAEMGWPIAPSAANFILADIGDAAESIYHYLTERRILVRWWSSPDLRSRLRISIGTDDDQQALADALREWRA